jgi:hypothetical protein
MGEFVERVGKLARGLLQPTAALLGAWILSGALTLPFLPTWLQLSIPLLPEAGREALPHERLAEQVEALDLAQQARVMLVRGSTRLVLEGVDEPDRAESEVSTLLERSGYRPDDWSRDEVFPPEEELVGRPGMLPIMLSIQGVVFLAAGLLLGRRVRRDGLLRAPAPVPLALAIGVAGGIVAVLASAAIALLLDALGMPVREQDWLARLADDPDLLIGVAPWVVLVTPVAEELFFRFYVFRHVAVHAGLPAGLVVSSILFALVHFNPTGMLVYFCIAVVLALAYVRSGSLVAPIAGHVTLNTIVLVGSAMAARAGP